jgi:sulfite dehydrogenase (cytochrome) subunit B
MNKFSRLAVMACGVISLVACAAPSAADKVSIDLPKDQVRFRPGPGAQVAQTYFVICHTAGYVYTQPPLTRGQWEGEVNKMRKVYGAPLPEDQVRTVVDYLMSQNGKS